MVRFLGDGNSESPSQAEPHLAANIAESTNIVKQTRVWLFGISMRATSTGKLEVPELGQKRSLIRAEAMAALSAQEAWSVLKPMSGQPPKADIEVYEYTA